MQNFLLYSIIGSVVLTVLINVLPMLFPKASEKAQRKVQETITESMDRAERGEGARIKVFFPWKAMLVISLVLTVLVNVVGYISR